ncbi:MAG TPA: response regulator transcription factor [Vicinamibacterales bacterium]|nr:response regulator transcription factor [Vicinamibacterales bacterium]HPW19922.1 response regulator transcription factor [Vicinamibacterales bacterium]
MDVGLFRKCRYTAAKARDAIVDDTQASRRPPEPARILVVDDDAELCELMKPFFERHGFALDAEHDGVRGLVAALEGRHDLIILDVMLPGIDGIQLLRRLRRSSNVPVILLTARTDMDDRIQGFDAGADDYLPKPFGPEELVARIRAVLRRAGRAGEVSRAAFHAGGLDVRPASRDVLADGALLPLTSIEFDILECLARAAGRVVSRDVLAALLHQRDAAAFDRSVDVHVHHLRKKLGRRRDLIRTIRGEGYLFRAD